MAKRWPAGGSKRITVYRTLVALTGVVLALGIASLFAIGDRSSNVTGAPDEPTTGTSVVPAGDALGANGEVGVGGAAPSEAPTPVPSTTTASAVTGTAAPRTASDVGITRDTIKLGFLTIDVTGGGRVGFAVGISPEQQEAAIRAFVADINNRGGIAGRKVEAYIQRVNLLDSSAGRRACLALTEDAKVFAVMGRLFTADALCVTREHRTFLLNNAESAPDETFAASDGLMFNSYARGSRMMRNWVAELDRARYLDGRTVGIVTDETGDPGGRTAEQLSAILQGAGHPVARITRLSGDFTTASSQIPIEVNEMRRAGADAVLLMGNALPDTQFVQQADGQRWYPRYAVSDWNSHAGDTANANMPTSYDGTLALTTAPVGRGTAPQPGWPEPPAAANCRAVYEKFGGLSLAARGTNEYSATIGLCDTIRIFELIARHAGPNPTRLSLRAAGERVGPIVDLAGRVGGSFGPAKHDLDDFVRLQRWEAGCTCFKPIEPFRRAKF